MAYYGRPFRSIAPCEMLMERSTIPFSVCITEVAVWADLVQLELEELQAVEYSSAEINSSDLGHDTPMISFFSVRPGHDYPQESRC